MKLSNTLMMNVKLMPTTKKAFTLAEVLITLSILGVVAALTIPSLVNRQSDLAAQVKLKKAISNYEDVIGVYMAETEKANAKGMLSKQEKKGGTGEDKDTMISVADCSKVTEYFKAVEVTTTAVDRKYCDFTTADGVAWRIDGTTGNATVTDNAKKGAARYAVTMWNANNRVNTYGSADGQNNFVSSDIVGTVYGGDNVGGDTDNHLIDKTRYMVTAPDFMQGVYYCDSDKTTQNKGCKE